MLRWLTLGFLSAIAYVSASIQDCDPSSRFRPTELALTPDPPIPGQPVAMTVRFQNPGPAVSDGTVTTSVTLNYIPFQPSTEPLCTNTACPIGAGEQDRSTSSVWPADITGKVQTQSVWTETDGSTLLCVKTAFTVRPTVATRLRPASETEWNATHAIAIQEALTHDDVSAKQLTVRSEL